ncbi:unnamed protein product [Rodentolepis nana]|uniref:Cadherin domain-containing protein n=1 Tax=Rodentolepis nana TaxID=102285 RepID=A0A0R3T4L8_RODNA|nr:unnamed protein product [Rodentolepis nana]
MLIGVLMDRSIVFFNQNAFWSPSELIRAEEISSSPKVSRSNVMVRPLLNKSLTSLDSRALQITLLSHAQVHVKVKPTRSNGPHISSFLHTDIEKPGSPGTVYATVSVTSLENPLNIHHSIFEPEAVALFELVRLGQQSKWQLQLKFQYPALSLSSKVGLTLEAVDAEIATVGHIPSSSRHFLEVTLLPQFAFQIRLPQELHLSVSEVALVNSTVITETGAVVVTKSIDLETPGTDRLEIAFTVVDRNNILLSSMADLKLVINILVYNEHSPEILNAENLPVGSEVLQLEARDPDFSATRLNSCNL